MTEETLTLTESLAELARTNFARWNDALQTKNAEAVAALYTNDTAFLPTLSPDFKQGRTDAVSYFQHFLEKNPFGTVVSEQVQALGENAYMHTGFYNFEVGESSSRSIVEARFTFVWVKEANGEWLIAHHHSSLKPQG